VRGVSGGSEENPDRHAIASLSSDYFSFFWIAFNPAGRAFQ